VLFGWTLSLLAAVLGIPGTGIAWVARRRLAQQHLDGALTIAALLAAVGTYALTRPWAPSSGQWPWIAAVALLAATIMLADLIRLSVPHRRGTDVAGSSIEA
jgi:hypothetical protein